MDVGRWRKVSDRTVWWGLVVLITVWGSAYALGSAPLVGGDEIMHDLKGATVARGQLTGEPHPKPIEEVPVYGPEIAKFQLQQWVAAGEAECYRGQPETVPTCFTFTGVQEPMEDVWYPDNKYQPIYYAWVGLPSRLVPLGAPANYVMRVMSVLITAMMLAAAVISVRRYRGARIAALGLLAAVTPTVIATAGQVQPSGLEISAALACWATTLLIALDARAGRLPDRRTVVRLAVTASVLSVVRPASPEILAVIVLSGLVVAGWRPCVALLKQRQVQVAIGAIAVAVAFTVVWYVWKKPILVGFGAPPSQDKWDLLRYAIGKNNEQFATMVGAFGLPDYSAQPAMQVAWAVLLGILAGLALLFARLRLVLWTVAVIGMVLIMQIGFDLLLARTIGQVFSAKYSLPIAVGVPLIVGFAAAEKGALLTLPVRRLRAAFAFVVVVVQVLALWQFLRRYAVGYSGPVWFWTQTLWSAPVPALLLLVAGIFAIVGFAVVVLGVTADPPALLEPLAAGDADPDLVPVPDVLGDVVTDTRPVVPADDHARDEALGAERGAVTDSMTPSDVTTEPLSGRG